ncbi:hypothetical protein CL656_04360 [bacterium]|nr:hypothetical protein [bacterium]|tara:strand:- start:7095 stop:8258 length:1164 start_codon:yes stop_codon:yes gene_type:complete
MVNINHRKCIICNGLLNKSVFIEIENMPPSAQGFEDTKEKSLKRQNGKIFQCSRCGHIQLDSQPVSYYKNVIRSVGISSEMNTYRRDQFVNLRSNFLNQREKVNVLEVGSASGDYAKILLETFGNVVATEKGEQGRKLTIEKGVNCVDTHPDEKDFKSKLVSYSCFDLICCFSYLEHLPDPIHTLLLFAELLSENGIILIEVPNSEMIFRNGLLNEVIPDHISYFTTNTSIEMVSRAGLEVVNSSTSWSDYIITLICRKRTENPLDNMFQRYEDFKEKLNSLFDHKLKDYSNIVVWGAGHQALFTISTTILKSVVNYIVDSSPAKQGLYAPGSGLQIKAPSDLKVNIPDVLIIACAGYNNEVKKIVKSYNLGIQRIYTLNGLILEEV